VRVDLERVKYLVREAARLQPVRPALWMGLRAALAVGAPMVLASQIGAVVTTWATLAGFGVVLVDKSGAYRTRAKAMLAATVGGALGALIGSIAADSSAMLAVIALGTALCGMAATWTGPAVAVGNTIALHLIVATTLPHDPSRPWIPALGFLAGGLWSMVLALVLWPVRVYRPARLAAARCLREVASQAGAIAAIAAHTAHRAGDAASWREPATRRHRAIRETLETARAVLAATRRGRRGEIGRGERLLVIVESVDQIFGVLIAVEEVLDNLGAEASAAIGGELASGLAAAVAGLDAVADRIVVEAELPALALAEWTTAAASARLGGLSLLARAEADHALALLARIHEDVAALSALVDSLGDEHDPAPIAPIARTMESAVSAASTGAIRVLAIPAPAPPSPLDALRGSLAWDSVVLRHASRVGIVALLSVVVTRALELQRGYWATLTAVLLLQPYLPATITRGVQRVGGTIAGGLIATLIAALVHDPLGIGIAAIVLAATSAAMIQVNYGLYALFLTPTFVLLAEVHAPDTHLVALRIANTLLGAGLAVAGALLLWPSRESTRTSDRLADAVEGAADYAHEVFTAVITRAPAPSTPVISARRRAGRALNNADLSLDRLVAEGTPATVLETYMTLATMTRRLSATLSAFATARHVAGPGEPPRPAAAEPAAVTALLTAIGGDTESYLRDAAIALRTGAPPPSYHRHDVAAAPLPALLAARLARIDRQMSILSEAVVRTVGNAPS
jgi:uncharacterized membrane protein YccC